MRQYLSSVLLVSACVSPVVPGTRAEVGGVLLYDKISDTQGGFAGVLDDRDGFGAAIAYLEDIDGDGIGDLAVNAFSDDDGNPDSGAVWILFLRQDRTVKGFQKISSTTGNFPEILQSFGFFGWGLASLGDLNGDGVGDLAISQSNASAAAVTTLVPGALWIVFLDRSGKVHAHQRITSGDGPTGLPLDPEGGFGKSVTSLGDLDGDGVVDVAVGAPTEIGGAVWILHLNSDGTIKAYHRISEGEGGFDGELHPTGNFGVALELVGDLDGDGVPELAVGARADDEGAVWILFLQSDGTVKAHQKISSTEGNFTGAIDFAAHFGTDLAAPGDVNGDGIADLAVGALMRGFPGQGIGTVWLLFLNADGTVKAHHEIGPAEGTLGGLLEPGDSFGGAVEAMGDVDGDGVRDLAVGAAGDDDGGVGHGAVWIVRLISGSGDDADGDGVSDIQDCDPLHGGAWIAPGPARELRLGRDAVSWKPPLQPGGDTVRYGLLVAKLPAEFGEARWLVDSTLQTEWRLSDVPAVARVHYYLVRAQNACGATAGRGSDGLPRSVPMPPSLSWSR